MTNRCLALLLLVALFPDVAPAHATCPPQEPPPIEEEQEGDAVPTPEEIAAFVARLVTVLAKGAFDEKVAALLEARGFADDDVVDAAADAIKDDALEVRIAALDTLGYLPLRSALKRLHGYAKKKKMVEDETQAVAIYKAIGRHGDAESIDLLEDDVFGSTRRVIEARILAIGRIRNADSVEALIALMNKAGKGNKGSIGQYMDDVRLALHVLTGADEGNDRKRWQAWWNDNKHTLEIDGQHLPELDDNLAKKWYAYWDEEPVGPKVEGKKKEDGGEPRASTVGASQR